MGTLYNRDHELQAPEARLSDLVISEAGDEVLAYDTVSHEIHHLNHVAWSVLSTCDGRRNIQAIAVDSGMDSSTVELAIEKLIAAGLVTLPNPGVAASVRSTSRRRMMQVAGGSAAVPVVVSITAPTSTMADSHCAELDEPCETTADCCLNGLEPDIEIACHFSDFVCVLLE